MDVMAKYLLLIYGDEKLWDARSAQDRADLEAAHASFAAAAGARIVGGHELEYSGTATTLRGTTSGRPKPTDGPFVETKEAIGGFYLLEAADLDEAISLAALLPEVREAHSGVEIRPVREAS
jgi:hypothetical protein